MSSVPNPCLDGGRTSGAFRAWSEDPLTARARAVWTGGDFHEIARSFAPGAAEFVSRLELKPGEKVLDVACGTGNLAIPAARAGATVTGVDIAPNLIAQARQEALNAGCSVRFEIGDAEALPYADREFATTISMFGAMFAYRPECAAAELVRVTARGGRIAMANWTPEGFVGEMLRAHTAVVPPPAALPSPLEWGREETVVRRFGDRVRMVSCIRRTMELRFELPPDAVTEVFAQSYGPTVATLRAADPSGASRLRAALTRLFREHNLAGGNRTVVAGEYLDVQVAVV